MGEKKKVLYIEDDKGSQRLVERVLGNLGYEVFIATDGLSGVAMAHEIQPHLILMDINLPRMDGRTITTRLRSLPHFVHTPIVALTASISAGNQELALAAGCTGFISKPIDVDAFPHQIESFLKGSKDTLPQDEQSLHLERYTQKIVEQLEQKVQELERTNQQLYQLERMKNDFLVLASHELRTPLTLVNGYTGLLEKRLQELGDEALHPIIDTAEKLSSGVARMRQVVEEIIHVSRISSGLLDLAIGPIQVANIVAEVVTQFEAVCKERSLQVYVEDLDHLPMIQADGTQIKAVIETILENAIKYTPDRGRIYIYGRSHEDDLELMIRDTGIGIPPEAQEQIFEPFFMSDLPEQYVTSRVDRAIGVGLGLTTARGIIKAHNGRIWVESEKRDLVSLPGSTFHVLLPKKLLD